MKIPYPSENRSRAGGLEGRDCTDHAISVSDLGYVEPRGSMNEQEHQQELVIVI